MIIIIAYQIFYENRDCSISPLGGRPKHNAKFLRLLGVMVVVMVSVLLQLLLHRRRSLMLRSVCSRRSNGGGGGDSGSSSRNSLWMWWCVPGRPTGTTGVRSAATFASTATAILGFSSVW